MGGRSIERGELRHISFLSRISPKKSAKASSPTPPEELEYPKAKTKKSDLAVKLSKATSILSGVAAGALGATAIVGLLSNPVGWGIAGGLLALAVVGVAVVGKKAGGVEAFKTAWFTLMGFTFGLSAAMIPIASVKMAIGAMTTKKGTLVLINAFTVIFWSVYGVLSVKFNKDLS